MNFLHKRQAITVFFSFACAYFLSALIRAITATLSPTLTQEFDLNAGDLGLLAGAYFLGFAAMQLPLGTWLDRHGPKKVALSFLSVAVLGCIAFSWASSFAGLVAARILCGVGVSACLMAALTGYRRWFEASTQMRANSWMLMTGSLGMVASTLPVQWLLPMVGWRALFLGVALLVLGAMALLAWKVPRWAVDAPAVAPVSGPAKSGYAEVWQHPYFRKMAPVGFFCYGGLVAMQTLWVSPWLIQVVGYTPLEAANGLFWVNVTMLFTFWLWGMASPWLVRQGLSAEGLMARGLPFSFAILAIIIGAGHAQPISTSALWALYCIGCTFVSLAQPAVGMAFPSALAGRALSAYNLVIFAGVFCIQWGVGLAIEAFKWLGLGPVQAYQAAMSLFLACCVASYLHFLQAKSHNLPVERAPLQR